MEDSESTFMKAFNKMLKGFNKLLKGDETHPIENEVHNKDINEKTKELKGDKAYSIEHIEDMISNKDVDGLIEILRSKTISRKFRTKSAKALQYLYLTSSVDETAKSKIKGVEWLLTKMIVDIEEKKRKALERAEIWWQGKPDPASDDACFICDSCNVIILQKEGTSLVGSYMRCAKCTRRLFESWDKE